MTEGGRTGMAQLSVGTRGEEELVGERGEEEGGSDSSEGGRDGDEEEGVRGLSGGSFEFDKH